MGIKRGMAVGGFVFTSKSKEKLLPNTSVIQRSEGSSIDRELKVPDESPT